MAIVSVEASSSISSSIPPWKYHVFLSFRGEDTRKNFCDHLYTALKQKGILTFRDDEELGRGEVISQELVRAIEDSLFSIVILSQNYASSTWCLTELKKILDSRKVLGRTVIPVFYGVDPSDVRHQRQSFAKAFREHEEKFKNNKEKVQKWRDALTEVANISGWDSQNRHEAELVQSIVEAIWIKLHIKLRPCIDNLVGINSKIEEINRLLRMSLDDVRFIGIWGMGGIGKTTIAAVVYESIQSEFEIKFFLGNVREICERYGVIHLQKNLVSSLYMRDFKIHNPIEGMKILREIFCNNKVLLILDDVSNKIQLDYLAVKQEWFGPGSRVIITTRDMHLLATHAFLKYEVQIMSNDKSLQLLCQKAFNKGQPEEGFLKLSNGIVKYASGFPLALEVLGTFLCKRSVSEWQDTLDKLKQIQPKDILQVLKISYDGLEDEELRTVFLDIACFFNRENTNKITQILASCGLHPTIGIKVLVGKALLIDEGGILYMHDLLQEMGRNIVLQESPNDPSRRSRLWSLEDINKVLRGNKGAEDIQGIVLKSQKPFETMWHPDCFSKMCNLRFLIVNNMHHLNSVKSISSALKVLRWERFPLKTLPNNVKLDELVDLEMCHSKIRQLWNEAQVFGKLKFINLSHCKNLIKTPNFARIPNLEILILESCISIVEVHPSLGQHKKLVKVNLRNCKSLKTLPSKLELNSLEELILSYCTKVRKLPEFGENMKRLRTVDVSGTAISEVPSSICLSKNLEHLNLGGCQGPSSNTWSKLNLHFRKMFGWTKIPTPLGLNLPPLLFPKLTSLNLRYCNLHDETFPNDFSWPPSLRYLDLSRNNFINLPADCMSNLLMLERLELSCCQNLQCFPQLTPNLHGVDANDQVFGKLKFIDLSGCNNLIKTPNFAGIPNLESLFLESCISIVEVHPSLAQHKKLVKVDLRNCKSLKTLPSKLELNSLEELILFGCTKVRKLPEFGENMKRLRTLDVRGIAISEVPSSICLLKNLEHLYLGGCQGPSSNSWSELSLPFGKTFGWTKITTALGLNLPPLLFPKLTYLDLSYCNLHDETFLNDLSWSLSLRYLDLSGNNFINLPADCISNLLMLKKLQLSCCQNLQCLPQLPPNLKSVYANDCPSMRPLLIPQQLWNLFPSILQQNCHLDYNDLGFSPVHADLALVIPGNEIPPWFHNQKFFFMDSSFSYISRCDLGKSTRVCLAGRDFVECFLYYDSAISIVVDIPDVCHSSEWFGIAVCLVLQEPIHPPSGYEYGINWGFASLEDQIIVGYHWHLNLKYNEPEPQLCIAFFSFDYDNCRRCLTGDRHQLRLIMYSNRYSQNKTRRSDEELLIKACGWRHLTKEDLQRTSTNNSGIHITEIVNDK